MAVETAASLSATASGLYSAAPVFTRLLQKYRPYICPFEALLPHVPQDATVLDVGCGAGLFLGLLAARRQIASGFGFDSSGAAIRVARQMAAHFSCSLLRFENLDARASFPPGPFQVVSIIDVLHHVPPPAQLAVLAAAADRLAPSGTLIYKDMAIHPRWRAAANRLHDLALARQWIHYLPIAAVKQWAIAAGFSARVSTSYTRYWYAHELLVLTKKSSPSR